MNHVEDDAISPLPPQQLVEYALELLLLLLVKSRGRQIDGGGGKEGRVRRREKGEASGKERQIGKARGKERVSEGTSEAIGEQWGRRVRAQSQETVGKQRGDGRENGREEERENNWRREKREKEKRRERLRIREREREKRRERDILGGGTARNKRVVNERRENVTRREECERRRGEPIYYSEASHVRDEIRRERNGAHIKIIRITKRCARAHTLVCVFRVARFTARLIRKNWFDKKNVGGVNESRIMSGRRDNRAGFSMLSVSSCVKFYIFLFGRLVLQAPTTNRLYFGSGSMTYVVFFVSPTVCTENLIMKDSVKKVTRNTAKI